MRLRSPPMRWLPPALLLCLALTARASVPHPEAVGSAFDADSGELLYTERHACADDAPRCTVEYRDPAGDLIARKRLEYTDSPHAPAVVMRDLRGGRELELAASEREDLVVDAGFDNYVRSRWEELAGGGTVTFPFQPVGFDRPLKMAASAHAAGDCAQDELCLQVEADSWFLGLLSDPIELTYSRQTRRLLRFVGTSNLRDADGDSPRVDIRYEYPAQDRGNAAEL